MIGVGIKDITVTIELVLRGEEVHMKIATGKLTKKFCLLMIMIAIAFAMVLQSSEEVSAASNDGGKWLWPVQPQNKTSYAQNYKSYITCKYGERDGNSIHKAIDIAPTASTKYILAARAGTIYYAGWDNSLGYHVKIKHSGGYYSIYAHLSNIYVEKNQSVKTGDKIGYMGSTGDSTGTHLHFQITKNWTYAVGWTDNANMDKTVNTNPENLPYVFTPLSNNKYYIKYSDGLSSTTNDSSIIPTQTATRGVSITTTSKKFTREGYAYDYWYIYKLVNGKAYYWCRDKNTGGNAGFYAYDAIPSTHNKVKIAHGGSINFSVDAGTILYLRPVWEEDTYYIKYSDGFRRR